MQHTVAAVFDNYNEAQHALDDLVASGFDRDSVHLTQNQDGTSGGTAVRADNDTDNDGDRGGGGISGFFRRLFGGDDDTSSDAELYSEAVRRGSYVVTVDVPDDDLVDRATDVLDRYHPIDIDERSTQWRSGGWASQESMRSSDTDSVRADWTDDGTDGQRQTITTNDANLRLDDTARRDTGEERSIPVIEEQLKVGKRQVQRGGVRIYQRVSEKPVNESVNLREEHVHVERHPVDQPASAADIDRLKDETIELRESAEEAVVSKSARVVEEVRVGKDVTERQEDINDTVRRTDVEIEQLGGESGTSRLSGGDQRSDGVTGGGATSAMRTGGTGMGSSIRDDSTTLGSTMRNDGLSGTTADTTRSVASGTTAGGTSGRGDMGVMGTSETGGVGMTSGAAMGDDLYRSHWVDTYGSSGGRYEDYEPAYRYGAGLRSDQRYQGRDWDSIESDVRTDWESSHAGDTSSTWERVKAAVRHGWERMTH